MNKLQPYTHAIATKITDTRQGDWSQAITRASVYSWQQPVPDSASCSRECRGLVHTCLA